MKKIITLGVLLISTQSFANTAASVFKKDSIVPLSLQNKVIDAIKAQCGKLISPYGLTEINTVVKSEKIDQGVVDQYYTTEFSSRYYFDGSHPVTTYITVESAEYSIANGENTEVVSVSSLSGCQ